MSQQLSQQAEYCSSMGAACCTLLWRVSRHEDCIHSILSGVRPTTSFCCYTPCWDVKGWSLVYAQYLQLRPGLVTPYIAEMGVVHRVAPYTTQKSQSHSGFLSKSQGHGGFSGEFTQSQPNFRQSQNVTPVAAVSIAHIGVTTPWMYTGQT